MKVASFLVLISLLLAGVSAFQISNCRGRISRLKSSSSDHPSQWDPSNDELNRFQWRQQTLYLKNKGVDGPPQGLLFDMDDKYPGLVPSDPSYDHLETLPLLPEATPCFPGSRHFLYINEMKFREMFSEVFKNGDKRMIRCFIDRDGAIEPVAVICRIVEHKLMKSGQAMYVIQAEDRVEINHVIQRPATNYLTAYYSRDDGTEKDPAMNEENEVLCQTIYNNLKVYLRLARMHSTMLAEMMGIDSNDLKILCLSPSILLHKPKPGTGIGIDAEQPDKMAERHSQFTSAIANLIQSSPSSMQLIMEGSVNYRLTTLSALIESASAQIKRELTSAEKYKQRSEAKIQDVLRQSMDENDDDSDIHPPASWTELSLSQVKLEDDSDEVVEESSEVLGSFQEYKDDEWGDNVMQ